MGERGKKKLESLLEFAWRLREEPPGGSFPPPPALEVQPLVAERAQYMKAEQHFCPTPWLPVFEAATYLEPALLRRAAPLPHGLPPMKQAGDIAEIAALAADLDRRGKLHLARPDEVRMGRACRLIPVYRDANRDRIVWDRRIQNAHEHGLRSASQRLVGGAALVDYELAPGCEPLIYAEDLSDYYPAFDGSIPKARTNVLARRLPASAVRHLKAFRQRGAALGDEVVVCVKGLLMGDTNAIDYAHGAHEALLQQAGSLADATRVFHHRPFPLGTVVEMLQIDDHVGLGQRLAGSRRGEPALDRSFQRASDAYGDAGLLTSQSKKLSGAPEGTVLGTEIRRDGRCGAERLRRMALALCSSGVAACGIASGALLRRLVAQWVHCLGYRRCMMCLLDQVFREMGDPAADDQVKRLGPRARQELALLAALAPLMETDLHAEMSDELISTDASMWATAATLAPAATGAVREVWRRRQLRGHHTRLSGAGLDYLRSRKDLEDRAWLQDLDEELMPEMRPPPWRLTERFEFLELCSGPGAPLTVAHAHQGLNVGPRIDLKLHPMWDLRSVRVVEWLVFLIARGRVWYVHAGAPCTTFSVARHPRLRSREHPRGFDPREPATALGNVVLARTLVVLFAARRCGVHGTHEHPASAYSWHLPTVQRLFGAEGGGYLTFSACMFGAAFRKDTRLGLIWADHLLPLARRCNHGRAHAVRLAGALTGAAAAYEAGLCLEWAKLSAAQLAAEGGFPAPPDDAPAAGGGRLEQPFVNEMVGGLPWREVLRARVEVQRHINVLEVRAALRAAAWQAARRPGLRQPYLLDSAVAIGCLAKGRSASSALNQELLRGLPPLLAGDHYPGFDFVPTRLNTSDDPSRGRPVRGVRSVAPSWAGPGGAAVSAELQAWSALPRQARATGEWARLVIKRCELWRLKRFDSTLGYPGEGWRVILIGLVWVRGAVAPRPAREARGLSRPILDLAAARTLQPVTIERRRLLVERFEAWLATLSPPIALAVFLALEPRVCSKILACYGQVMYSTDGTHGAFVETINGVVDRERSLRRQLAAAWDVARTWQEQAPVRHRVPTPLPLMQALVALALSWGWWDMAVLIYLSFVCMLRPGEAQKMTVGDLVLPSNMMSDKPRCFVRVREPKGRWAVARMEHVRCDEVELVRFLELWTLGWPRHRRLLHGPTALYRRRHDMLVRFFGVAAEDGVGITPSSHRGGGATWIYQESEDLNRTQWRGRWRQIRTLEIYVQEVSATTLLTELSVEARARISRFAQAAPAILQAAFTGMLHARVCPREHPRGEAATSGSA